MKQVAMIRVPGGKLEAVVLAEDEQLTAAHIIIQRREHREPVTSIALSELNEVTNLYNAVNLWHIKFFAGDPP